jgi:hypothetical protein
MIVYHGSILVMAGLVPAIHVYRDRRNPKTWMPGTRPGMTQKMDARVKPGHDGLS